MMSKKRISKELDDNKKDDIMEENIDAKAGIISIFKETADMDDSEDCLYMNIYIPASGTKNKAIVMYIHGGMFVSGGASAKVYDFSIFSTFGDVIVAVPQYRLGVFGFMHANITDEMPGTFYLI